jgi:hypothetical protein
MTTLMEELRLAVREIWQSIGFDGSANTAAAVVPVVLLGIAMNVVALSLVDRVRPIKGKTQVVGAVRAEARLVQNVTVCVLRQIEGRQQGLCSIKRCASSRLEEIAKRRIAAFRSHAAGWHRNGVAIPCADHSPATDAGNTLRAI